MTLERHTQALLDAGRGGPRAPSATRSSPRPQARAAALLDAGARRGARRACARRSPRSARARDARVAAAAREPADAAPPARQQRAAALLADGWQRLPEVLRARWGRRRARGVGRRRRRRGARACCRRTAWRITHGAGLAGRRARGARGELPRRLGAARGVRRRRGAARRAARSPRAATSSTARSTASLADRAEIGARLLRPARAGDGAGEAPMSRASIRWISGPVLRARRRRAVRAARGGARRSAGAAGRGRAAGRRRDRRAGLRGHHRAAARALEVDGDGAAAGDSARARACSATSSTACCGRCPARRPRSCSRACAARRRAAFDFAPRRAAGRRARRRARSSAMRAGAGGRAAGVLVPPDADGEVVVGRRAGRATPRTRRVCTLRAADGATRELSMGHDWPVRVPRPVRAPPAGERAAGHRPAHPRLPVPGGAGRQGGDSGRLRHRQDGAAGGAGQGLQRRRHRLPRLRRARQRDGRRAGGIPAAHRPAHRPAADGAHGDHRQHLEHAGGRARGVDLLGDHRGRVLPRPGPRTWR